MVAYRYKAISKSGSKVSGVIDAYDEYEAVAKIKEECDVVLKIEEVPEGKKEPIDINEPLWVEDKVLALTASQFAILLQSGLPASRTVAVIAEQTDNKLMKKILSQVAEDVAAGYSLSGSLETRGKKIPATFIETVRAGEQSGTLEESFKRLHDYYDKRSRIRSKVKGAMIYPLLLVFLAIVVVTIVVKVAVPTVLGVIIQNGGDVPLPTKMLLGIYNFFEKFGILFLIVLILLVIGFKMWQRTENGRIKTSQWMLKLPVLGKINRMNVASQFASTMTTLLSAGLPTSQAVRITGKVMDNYSAGNSVASASVGLEEGKRLGEVLRDNPYLENLLVEMTAVGEESGSLEDTLTTIGAYYDQETEQASAKALSMLEPAITIVLGVVIGFIVISLYLPMFTMYTGM